MAKETPLIDGNKWPEYLGHGKRKLLRTNLGKSTEPRVPTEVLIYQAGSWKVGITVADNRADCISAGCQDGRICDLSTALGTFNGFGTHLAKIPEYIKNAMRELGGWYWANIRSK